MWACPHGSTCQVGRRKACSEGCWSQSISVEIASSSGDLIWSQSISVEASSICLATAYHMSAVASCGLAACICDPSASLEGDVPFDMPKKESFESARSRDCSPAHRTRDGRARTRRNGVGGVGGGGGAPGSGGGGGGLGGGGRWLGSCGAVATQSVNVSDQRGHQRPSEAIRGHQRPSEAIRDHQRVHQRPSEAISGHQWPAIKPGAAFDPVPCNRCDRSRRHQRS